MGIFTPTPDIGEHEMRVMDPEAGDLKSTWDPDNDAEVEAAEDQFDALIKKGMVAYKVDKKGEKTEIMKKFDKSAHAIIFAPRINGG